MVKKKLVSIVTPCYNEEENIEEVVNQVKNIFSGLTKYNYEHIVIDNASSDSTQKLLRSMASKNKCLKVIFNARNFGHIKSPFYGLLQAKGDAVILLVADLQDPIEKILEFLNEWENGFKIVVGVKNKSKESPIFFAIRKFYYGLINLLSRDSLIKNFTGFGLYDRRVIDILRTIKDPYPYFRGLICEIGFEIKKIPYIQPVRLRGFTKNNLYTLYDIAMLGITNHSKVPLRLAVFSGFLLSVLSFSFALLQVILKLIFWDSYSIGVSTIVVSIFFFSSVQLFFIGILGEYIGSIHTQVLNRPLVIEKERLNF